eukprot:604596-Karenia_brevis.AAC.1
MKAALHAKEIDIHYVQQKSKLVADKLIVMLKDTDCGAIRWYRLRHAAAGKTLVFDLVRLVRTNKMSLEFIRARSPLTADKVKDILAKGSPGRWNPRFHKWKHDSVPGKTTRYNVLRALQT